MPQDQPTQLVVREEHETAPLTAAEIKNQVNLIQEVMAGVMKSGTHFGTIPGAGSRPVPFKPGAEKLAMTFRFAPLNPPPFFSSEMWGFVSPPS